MKVRHYLVIGAGLVALLLVAGWLLRNILIQQISNPLLDQYGLTVTDVSLDALATRDARIGYLELRHANGATIAIEDLRLPIRTSAAGRKHYSAAKITVGLPPLASDEPVDFAGILGQLLELPQQFANTDFSVGEINAPPYPAIRDMHWTLSVGEQQLMFVVDAMSLSASLARSSDTDHQLSLSFSEVANVGTAQSIVVDIRRSNTGMSLIGTGTLDLRLWSPIIAMLGVDVLDVVSGSATLQFDGEVADDPNQIPFINADITPTTPIRLTVAGITDAISSVTVESASTTEINATITDFQWSLSQPGMQLRIADSGGNEFSLSLANLSCDSDLACTSEVAIVAENLVLPVADIARFEYSGNQDVTIGEDGPRVLLRPDAQLGVSGIVSPQIEVARFSAQLTSEAEFTITGNDWQFNAGSADVRIDKYAIYDGVAVSVPLFLDKVFAAQTDGQQSASFEFYAAGSSANWNKRRIQLPGARGRVAFEGAEVDANFETDGLYEDASIELHHNLDEESGNLLLADAGLSFSSQALSKRVSPWRFDWDISAGTVGLGMRAAWQKAGADWQINAQGSVRVAELAGAWQDTAFAGLSTNVDADIDTGAGITVRPSTIQVAFVDVGLPVENISADYTLYPDDMTVDVRNLSMSAFGGKITADPFSFSTARESNNLLVHVESIDLAKVLSPDEFESIQISGKIGAELPVTIEGKNLTVTGGKLTGDIPGGVIRYLPGIGSGAKDASGLGFATRALSNFEYETLTSEVNYGVNGDLKLQMRLTGRNPDLEGGRQIILNLGVEDNVLQLLRSLQAARAVEDILERRLAQ